MTVASAFLLLCQNLIKNWNFALRCSASSLFLFDWPKRCNVAAAEYRLKLEYKYTQCRPTPLNVCCTPPRLRKTRETQHNIPKEKQLTDKLQPGDVTPGFLYHQHLQQSRHTDLNPLEMHSVKPGGVPALARFFFFLTFLNSSTKVHTCLLLLLGLFVHLLQHRLEMFDSSSTKSIQTSVQYPGFYHTLDEFLG